MEAGCEPPGLISDTFSTLLPDVDFSDRVSRETDCSGRGAVILLSMMLTPSIRPRRRPPNAADLAAEEKP